jgi:anti-sigma factor RsiW
VKCEEAARLIDPYLDGELDLTACVVLEEHLADCIACRKKQEARQALTFLVREEAPRFKASPFLATRIRAALRAEKPAAGKIPWWHSLPTAWIYLGVAAVFTLFAFAFFLSGSGTSTQLAREAISDHVRSLQVNHLMDIASTDQHTVKPWFAGKLDYSPQVIDLSPSGYPLVGGRLDVLDHRNVAAIIYQRRKHFINLFIWPADKSSLDKTFYEEDGYHVLEWTKSGMNYLAVSELGEKELREFTTMIQDQIVPPME